MKITITNRHGVPSLWMSDNLSGFIEDDYLFSDDYALSTSETAGYLYDKARKQAKYLGDLTTLLVERGVVTLDDVSDITGGDYILIEGVVE